MGYMTVIVCLNDHVSDVEKSPKTAAYKICHAPLSERDKNERWDNEMGRVHTEFGEPRLSSYALNVLPTFHADDVRYYKFGYNSYQKLTYHSSGEDKKTGKKWIKLEIE